jgi:TRAP-type C4-dicarboxylate transport system substrate-binding protein
MITTFHIGEWQKEVEEKTGGRVTFENHWAGALFAPGATLDSIEKRMADLVNLFYGYAPSTLPLGNYEFAIPFRPADPALNYKITRMMWDEMPAFEQELANHNAKMLMFLPVMTYDVLSRMPIKTLDDFKGKKMASVGRWFTQQVEATGAVSISNPAGERYVMFERGVIDGEVLVLDQMNDWKHYEVAKHFTHVGFGSLVCAVNLVITLDAWNELPPDIQKIMVDTGRKLEAERGTWLNEERDKILKRWKETEGVSFYTMPEADKIKWANQMADTASAWAKDVDAKGLPGSEIINRYVELAEQEGHKWPVRPGTR